jgi:putative ATP-binding cassette transporter
MTTPATGTSGKSPNQGFIAAASQLWRLITAFYKSERRRKAQGYTALLLSLSVATVVVTVVISYAGRDLMTAIENKNSHAYWSAMWRYLGTFAIAVLIDVYYRWSQESLTLVWREWMTQHLIKRYFNNRAYYRLRGSDSIDNPDQRISEDVRNFCIDSITYVLLALGSVMTLIGFLGVLWSISGELVSVAFIYAVFGTFMCFKIGHRLVGLHYERYQKEADLRYGLVRVRDNAESIAFYRGEKREHLDLIRRLGMIVGNMRTIIVWNRNLGFWRNSYAYLALLLPILIVAPMFMRGEVQFGVVTQTVEAFAQVLAAVSVVSNNFEGLSIYLAGIRRLGSQQQLDETSTIIKLDKLTMHTPDGMKLLAKDLSFALSASQSLLIMGASGAGKSSILRIIAGLWPGGSGSLERPALNRLMFLPQRPYMLPGSLRDQLRYPDHDPHIDDEAIRKVVEMVNLSDVLARVEGDLDCVIDWTNILSLGEQQRVAFARLFLRRPQFVFLDEATSALDEENQSVLYKLIQELGIGFISVGHRETLVPFHECVLHLKKMGEWEVRGKGEG